MELLIRAALILNVLAYHRFIAMLANRAGEITVRPKLTTTELLFHLRATPEHLPRRQTLLGSAPQFLSRLP